MSEARKNCITWDEYFMTKVCIAGLRAKTDLSQGGACLVNNKKRLLSVGYGGISLQTKSKLGRENTLRHIVRGTNKESAIKNLIYNFSGAKSQLQNSKLYSSNYFDFEDTKFLSQIGIDQVYCLVKNKNDYLTYFAGKTLKKGGITFSPYNNDFWSLDQYDEFLDSLLVLIKDFLGDNTNSLLTDDEYFMTLALLSALRSKDPSTQVGSCIVDPIGRIISMGYNGLSTGVDDSTYPWGSNGEITGDLLRIKDYGIVHSEINAALNYPGDGYNFKDCTLYVSYSPCPKCTVAVSSFGISAVEYFVNYSKPQSFEESSRFYNDVGITFNQYIAIDKNGNINSNYTKDELRAFFNDLTRLIKANLGKEKQKKMIYMSNSNKI